MTKPKFVYFDGRGLGETARLIMRYGKLDFEDVRLTHDQWPEHKPKTKTGKVPYLEIDGHTIVESYAIDRFLARRFNLAGKDEFEQALVDGIADVAKDFYANVAPWLYAKMGYREGNPTELIKPHLWDQLEVYLPVFSKFLKESKSGFLAPSGLTWADFVLSEFLITITQAEPTALDKYTEFKEFIQRVKAVPQLKDYYASRKE